MSRPIARTVRQAARGGLLALVIAGQAVSAGAETNPPPPATEPPAATPPVPGITVTPHLDRRPRALQPEPVAPSEAQPERRPSDNQPGGCRYNGRKLELIV